jgi:S1-C subfamily serine protease
MDLLDVVIVVAAVAAAVGGYRLGFFTRVLSWIGLGLGIYAAGRFLPDIIAAAKVSDAAVRLVLAAVVLVGAAFLGQAAGMLAGARLHRVLRWGPLRAIDQSVGGVVGLLGVVAALWLLLPSLSSVTGWPARATRNSVISRWVSNDLPSPPNALESLRRLVGNDEFPQVFDSLEPGQSVGRPPAADPLSPGLTAEVARSTVMVQGQACDRIQDGSGFTVGPDLVVTNAHVVAGEPAPTGISPASPHPLAARVVLYDPNRDLALLHVPGLDERPLTLARGVAGSEAAVFGHPEGHLRLAVQPALIGEEIAATGKDLYDRHTTSRDVFVLAAALAPGDSGGALVGTDGHVVGVAFAIALDRSGTAYALTSKEIEQDLGAPRSGRAIGTGACLDT